MELHSLERRDDTYSPKETSTSSTSTGLSTKYKAYKKRPASVDNEYQIMMCADYALKFGISEDVIEFEMSTNDDECGHFNDIKMEVVYKNGTRRVYLFQLKYDEHERRITKENLCAEPTQKNIFSLVKYFKAISTEDNNNEAILILCTNSSTKIKNENELLLESKDSVIVKNCSNMEYTNLLMNNKTPEGLASIFQFKLKTNKSNLNEDALKQFYLFTNQKNVDHIRSFLKQTFDNLLCDISESYIQFIRDWYSRNFVLTKHDLITKVTELALSPYIKVISGEKCNEKSKHLEQAVMEHEMTLIQNCEEDIVENIWRVAEDHNYSKLDVEKFMLKDDSSDVQKTKILWYLNKAPLIVKVDDSNKITVLRVLKLTKTNLNLKKIVLLGNITKTDFNDDWTMFETLSDLVNNCRNKKYCYNILQNFKVSLQGRQQTSLKCLIEFDEEMATIIGTKQLFIMSQAHFLQIGGQKLQQPDLYIPRTISTIFLDIAKTLKRCIQIKKCILIINCNENFRDKVDLKRFTVGELSRYLQGSNIKNFYNLVLFTTKHKCTNIQFDQVCSKSPKSDVYVLQILDDKCGTLLQRKGSQLPLDLINYEKDPVKDMEIFRYFNNPLNVICAPSGMGKSTLLTNICNTCPAEYWCIYINLINHNNFLKTCLDHDQIWKHFLELQQNNQNPLLENTVSLFLKSKKIQLFLDGLDEIDSKYVDTLLAFIKYVSSEKANVWVSSRENLREKILKYLNIVPIEIQELNQIQQKMYICDRLQYKHSDEEIKTITETIFNSADVTNSQQILGIPMQLYIITENFIENTKSTDCLQEQYTFVLTAMYKQFFEGKKKFVYVKLGIDELGFDFNVILRKYELLALHACLDKTDFDRLNLDLNEKETLIKRIKNEGDKFGIIKQITEDGETIFNHQTYAEYLASVWLKRHPDKAYVLQDQLFLEKYENFRIFFDILLGEDSPLHLAVIYKNMQEVEKNIAHHDVKDHGGRKALHLACSYGLKQPPEMILEHTDEYENGYDIHLQRESECNINIIEMLLSQCDNALDCCNLFDFSYADYSLRAHCLCTIEKLLEKHLLSAENFYKVFDQYNEEMLLRYACFFGSPQIFSHVLNYNSQILDMSSEYEGTFLLEFITIGSNDDNNTTSKKEYLVGENRSTK